MTSEQDTIPTSGNTGEPQNAGFLEQLDTMILSANETIQNTTDTVEVARRLIKRAARVSDAETRHFLLSEARELVDSAQKIVESNGKVARELGKIVRQISDR